MPTLVYAQAYTGKVVIDGVEYGGDSVVRGNHRRAEETRSLSCFDRITVEAGVDVIYRPGNRCQAKLSGDSNLLGLISTEVGGDRLHIGVSRSIQSEGPLRVEVQSPKLTELEVAGSGNVKLTAVDTPKLKIEVGGSGNVQAEGRAGLLEVAADGSGNLDLARLKAEEVTIDISGAADAKVYAARRLKADISGAGNVTYYGRPTQVVTDISGAGDVEPGE
ncbi:MAG: DUF2807 domain-containing protein [Methylohalobius sp.]|nr:DUF2807 domain-containing protein [Methylohalobius sp.]